MSKLRFSGVEPDMADALWPQCEPLITSAFERGRGELTGDDCLGFVKTRDMQLWILFDNEQKKVVVAGVTEIIKYPRKRVVRVVAMGGGTLEIWGQGIQGVERWAESIGVDGMEAYARNGVEKFMKKNFGYEKYHSIIGRDFEVAKHEPVL